MSLQENNGHNEELEALAIQLQFANENIKRLKEELTKANKDKEYLQRTVIPDTMFQHGLTSAELTSGARFFIKMRYLAREPHKEVNGKDVIDREKQAKFHAWLEANGHGGLVKFHFRIDTKDSDAIQLMKDVCADAEISYSIDKDIHWKTLEAWYEEQVEKGANLPLDLFENNIYREATLK